jgi:1,4-alpha-glucan branching enzyme
MGARPHTAGTSFRVWAPHATRVFVSGEFNDWSDAADELAHEGGGYWSCDVAGAKYRDEYEYVIENRGDQYRRNDPYAREVSHSNGHSIVIDPSFDWGDEGGFQMPAWNDLVIYELHVGTFNDTLGGPPGNFDKAISRLPYLRDTLGINAIKVMPPCEFPGAFSWGYNPAHIFAIEREYGGPKAFRRFIRTAHEHGIAVILDVVYNHLGPFDLDLWQFDGWSQSDHQGGIYFYDNDRSSTPWGHTRPDYGREEVRRFLCDNALFWLQEFHADGLRFDATAFIRTVYGDRWEIPDGWGLMQSINQKIGDSQPWKITIAEDLRNYEWLTRSRDEGGAGFASQWDAAFVHPVREALIAVRDEDRNLCAVRDAIYHRYGWDATRRVIYTESHDEVANGKARVPQEVDPGDPSSWYAKKRSTLGAAIVMTSPGIPMIFQGQEFLEDRWFDDQDPLEWWRQDEYSGIVNLYRDLILLRRNGFHHTRGLGGQHVNVFHVNDRDKLIAYHRWENGGPGDDVVVVANFANRSHSVYTLGFPRGGRWKVRFNSDWRGYDPSFENASSRDTVASPGRLHDLPFTASVGIGRYTAIVLSQEP